MTIPTSIVPIGWTTTRLIAAALAAVVVLAVAGFVAYRVFWAPIEAKRAVAAAKGETAIAGAGVQSGAAAVGIVSGNAQGEKNTDQTTRTNYVYITKAAGAGDPVNPGVDAAGRRAVCLRASAAGLPDCQRLREAHP